MDPTLLDLDLGAGESATRTVSITLNNQGAMADVVFDLDALRSEPQAEANLLT